MADNPQTAKSRPAKSSQQDRGTSSATGDGSVELLQVEAFDLAQVRPWRFHNRADSGMDDSSLTALATSIRQNGQQQLGLGRRLQPGDTHAVEVIFGVRRLEACRRAGVPWRAEVRDASFSDAECAALMHGENEWTEGVSPLENAVQWKSMLDAGVFKSQSALAEVLGCHRGTVSRAVRTATALVSEEWIERLVRPVMHQFTGRSADRLADACADDKELAMLRAASLSPGQLGPQGLYDALFGKPATFRETVFVRRKGRAGGVVAAKIERDDAGGWSVQVRAHKQSPAEKAELAEQVEALLAQETADASGVRMGRRLATLMSPEEAKGANQAWLEGCVWAAAQASGLDWDRWRCAGVAQALHAQTGGWKRAVVRAVGGRDANPAGVPGSP